MSENDKNVPLIIRDFHTEVCETHLVFSEEEISRFHIWNFKNGRSFGGTFIFFQLPWDNQISTILKLSVYTHVVLLINFREQFELHFYINIQ